MSTTAQRHQIKGEENTVAPAIASDVLRSLVIAVTKVIKAAISNAKVPVDVTPKTITYYPPIDLYINE